MGRHARSLTVMQRTCLSISIQGVETPVFLYTLFYIQRKVKKNIPEMNFNFNAKIY